MVAAVILLFGSGTTIAGLYATNTVVEDCCVEVYYDPSMYALFSAYIQSGYSSVANELYSEQDDIVYDACNEIENICNSTGYVCVDCNEATVDDFENSTLVDSGTGQAITVEDCATNCTNATIRALAADYVTFINFYEQLIAAISDVEELMVGFTEESLMNNISSLMCDIQSEMRYLYTGCALFLIGTFIAVVPGVFLEKQ